MSVPKSNKRPQIQYSEEDSGDEEKEKMLGEVLGVSGRRIGNRVELAATEIERMGLRAVERAGTATAEDGQLVTGLVDGAVAVDALRNGEGRAAGASRGDEFGTRTRAETGKMRGVVPRGKNLQDAQAVLAVGNEGKGAGGDHADLHVVNVIELAFGGEELVEFRRVRFFDVNDAEALLPCRNVRVRARDMNIASVFEGDEGAGDWFWLCEVCHVENLQSVTINDERITELDSNAMRIVE